AEPEADHPAPEADHPAPEADQPAPEAEQPEPEADHPAPEADHPAPEADQPEAEPERQSAELDTVLTPTEEPGTGGAAISPSTEADEPAAEQVEPTDLPPIWMLDRRPHEPEFEKGNEEDTPAEIDDPILEGLARLAEADFDEEEDDTLTHADPAGAVEAESAQVHEPDDLTLIRGIGPKIALLLQSRGITRFGQLATASVEQINDILEAGGQSYTLADPSMWSLQAHLAAEGRWLALRALQAAGKDVD
ncbi:MAG: hypothetical protein OEX04_16390, partial [Acidimicrobiia bacterium]|nr:hypothetical protein [Acidimicrobiia bacterium]